MSVLMKFHFVLMAFSTVQAKASVNAATVIFDPFQQILDKFFYHSISFPYNMYGKQPSFVNET